MKIHFKVSMTKEYNIFKETPFLIREARMELSNSNISGSLLELRLFSSVGVSMPAGGTLSAYWYQGVFLTQRRVNPASVRILIEAASASRTVSFTDCMRFWAL